MSLINITEKEVDIRVNGNLQNSFTQRANAANYDVSVSTSIDWQFDTKTTGLDEISWPVEIGDLVYFEHDSPEDYLNPEVKFWLEDDSGTEYWSLEPSNGGGFYSKEKVAERDGTAYVKSQGSDLDQKIAINEPVAELTVNGVGQS